MTRGSELVVAVTVVGWADDDGAARGPRRRPARGRRRRDRRAGRLGRRPGGARGARRRPRSAGRRVPAPRAAPGGRARAGPRRSERADRPLRRPGHRRPPRRRGQRQLPEIALERLPVAPGVAEVARALGTDGAELAATGGEDYELCVCVPAAARAAAEDAADVTWVARCVRRAGCAPHPRRRARRPRGLPAPLVGRGGSERRSRGVGARVETAATRAGFSGGGGEFASEWNVQPPMRGTKPQSGPQTLHPLDPPSSLPFSTRRKRSATLALNAD